MSYAMSDGVILTEDVTDELGTVASGTFANIAGYPGSDRVWDLWLPNLLRIIRVHESGFRKASKSDGNGARA
jgi:hypothetical protein